MPSQGWSITSWQEVAVLVSIVGAVFALLGGLVKSYIDKRNSDASTQDRIIRLVEVEADKRVEIVRTEFKLQIAEMQLRHQKELTSMRNEFDRQLKAMKTEHDTFRCDHAPACAWRHLKTVPPAPTAK